MAAAAYYDQPQNFRLGGTPFKHGSHAQVENQYDHYREEARRAHDAHNYQKMNEMNEKASQFIFRENNAPDRVRGDEIDLHGQFVHEAEEILGIRIREMKAQQQPVLHVIVGKGNHSPHHIQKIKPAVEHLCQEQGLRFETEANEGRIKVYLQGGPGANHPQQGYQPHQQPHYGGPGKPQQQFQPEAEKLERDLLRKCIKSCCTIM